MVAAEETATELQKSVANISAPGLLAFKVDIMR